MSKAKMKEKPLRLRGYLEYELRDARSGVLVRRGKSHNVVTAIGRSFALKQCFIATTNMVNWLMLGTDTSATASNSSNLGGYFSIINSTRATTASTTATNSACTFTLAASWASTETHTSSTNIGEFALLNSSATGASMTMFNRVTTGTAINFQSTNTLAVTITITN